MSDRPFAYVCSPLRGDIAANMERAREYSRQVFEAGYCPITPHIYFPAFLRDNIPEEREAGMAMGESLLPQCRVLVVCGDTISDGMAREIRAAERLNIPILTLDVILPETARDRSPAASPLIGLIEEIREGANEKGYVITLADFSEYYIPNALHVERNDNIVPWEFEDDEQAARGAEKDGVKLIYGMVGIDDGVYIDTPENRRIIENTLAERDAVSAAAPSDPVLGGESNRHTLSVCFDNPEEEHSGWWLGFPTTTESVHAVLKEIGVYSGDVVATDYTSGIPILADRLGMIMEPDNVDELNYLAVRLQGLEGYGREVFEAALEAGKHCGSVKNIINLTFPENINRFDLLPVYDAGQYGDFLINSFHQDEHADAFNRLEESDDPDDRALAAHIERLEAHIDFEAYGRDVVSEEKGNCKRRTVREDRLIKAVLDAVRVQIKLVQSLSDALNAINQRPNVKTQSNRLTAMLKMRQAELDKIVTASDSLYMDWKNGDITKEDYRRMKSSFDEKADALRAAVENINDEINTLARGVNANDPYLTTFLKHKNITELNRGIVVELINTIYVHEDGQLTIEFSFADELKRVLDFIENNKNDLIVVDNQAVS